MHSLQSPYTFPPQVTLSSDERYLQYSEGEAIIAAAEDNESALIPAEFQLMLNMGARIIRNANNGVRDSAVQA